MANWECVDSIVQSGCDVALSACAYRHGAVCTLTFHFALEINASGDLVLSSFLGCYKEECFRSGCHSLQVSK